MKKVSIFLSLLLITAVCLGCSAAGESQADKEPGFSGDAQVKVVTADGTALTIDEKIMSASEVAVFETTQGKSGEEPETNTHRGVLLKNVLSQAGVNIDSVNEIKCTSLDGFSKVYSKTDLNDPEKLFLTFQMDGEQLTYNNQDCFFIVAKNESFKQNWSKFLGEIVIS